MLRLVKLGVLPYGLLFGERRPGLIILIYHRVGGGTASEIDLPTALFDRQMAFLRTHTTTVSMDDIAEKGWEDRPAPSADLVAVTFDDGYREIYEHAFPVLLRYRIPATIYLSTGHVERSEPFDFGGYAGGGSRPYPLSWAQVREMVASGLVTAGAHSETHADLTRLAEGKVRAEVGGSRRAIEDRVGVTPRHFAYPWGRLTEAVRRVVGEHFATAVRGGCGKNPFGALDPLALWRRPIQQSDGFWFFRLKLRSYLDAEESFRRLAERGRPRPREGLRTTAGTAGTGA